MIYAPVEWHSIERVHPRRPLILHTVMLLNKHRRRGELWESVSTPSSPNRNHNPNPNAKLTKSIDFFRGRLKMWSENRWPKTLKGGKCGTGKDQFAGGGIYKDQSCATTKQKTLQTLPTIPYSSPDRTVTFRRCLKSQNIQTYKKHRHQWSHRKRFFAPSGAGDLAISENITSPFL